MSAKALPSRPSLEFYKKQAKQFLKECLSRNANALRRIREFHPRLSNVNDTDLPGAEFALADAQWIIALEHGFESWPKFVHHIDQLSQKNPTVVKPDTITSSHDMVAAAQKGDVAAARALLRADPSLINSKDEEGQSLLYVTAMHGFNERHQNNRAFVEFLIEYGAEVDLHAAAFLARPDRVREILGRNPKAVNQTAAPYDCTALHYAAERGNLETVKALAENGADLNVRDKFGRTPLAVAAHAGPWKPEPATDVINYLLAHGATLDLFGAAALGKLELLELVLAHGRPDIGARDSGGCTALWHAARNNRMDAVRWLIEHGAPVNAANADGQTALSTAVLHLLARQTEPVLIQYLVEKGALPNACAAAALGDVNMLRRLLHERPESVNEQLSGYSPAYYALHCWKPDCLRELARAGASMGGLESDLKNICGSRDPKLLAELFEPRAAIKFLEAACEGKQADAKRILADHPSLPTESIFVAAMLGEIDIVEAMLKRDVSLAAQKGGPKNWEPLLYVSFSRFHLESRKRVEGIVQVAKRLLAHGADPNTYYPWEQDAKNKLPALWAATAESNNPALARVLLEAAANPNDSESVYHCAEKYHVECLELLHEFGADLSGPFQPWNNSPIYFLLSYHRSSGGADTVAKGIRWLLEHGANPNMPSYEQQECPIHQAARNGWGADLFELFARHGADLNMRTKDGKTAYAIALRHGNTAVSQWLQNHGAGGSLSTKDEFLSACARGDEKAVRAYLSKEPEWVSRLEDEDRFLIHSAANAGNVEAIRVMLDAGWSVDTRWNDGATPLHCASWFGQIKVVRLLLSRGAPVNIQDPTYHSTPLGHAIHGSLFNRNPNGDYPAVVEALIAAGAPLPEKSWGSEEVQAVLKRVGSPESWTPLHLAVMKGDLGAVRALLEGGAEVESRDAHDKTPFFWAIIKRNFAIAEILLQRGADVNTRWKGYSLLHHEAKDGKAATVEFLLKHGANPNIRDDRVQPGSTPLHGAARQDRLKVAQLLIEHGADVNAMTDLDQTPMDAARTSKKQKVVALLLSKVQ